MQHSKQKIYLDEVLPVEISAPASDPALHEQVVRYRSWLAAQAISDPATDLQLRQEYAERASTIVEVGERRIQTFAPFRYKYSALQTITSKQSVMLIILGLIVVLGGLWDIHQTFVMLVMLVSVGYMLHLILDFVVAVSAVSQPTEEHIDDKIIHALHDAEWPVYTILCPLYREARVIPQFVKAMQGLDYPTEKLQILFLTEVDDTETRAVMRALHLPSHFQIITVPDGSPRTKPRACNYGLIEATGQYVVIYDAEDIPDPLQLKKAVLTFANHGANLACIQAKLNFYNPDQNLLTRWFTAEYSLWFDLILPGLQQLKLAIPLGGTSNHFPTQTLRALGGWDGFNVTEDCDLGLRLAWFRLETIILNSTTYEEANSRFKNWIRQRSRWIKGYMQTYLVHMREPQHYFRQRRFRVFFSLQMIIGGKAGVLLVNPIMWILLIISLVFRPTMNAIYGNLVPLPIFYISATCLIVGNFFYSYIYLLGCMRRKQYQLIKWMLLIPLYWLMGSIAAGMAFYQLITKPHYWEKTQHGLHLQQIEITSSTTVEEIVEIAETLSFVPLPVSLQKETTALPIHKYTRLAAVPVASVQDTIKQMIKPQKPAFSSAERAALRQSQHVEKKDYWPLAVLVVTCIVSIISCRYYFQQQQILLSSDALYHLDIARSIITGANIFDLTKQGKVWLPLPHLLMLPFVWNYDLWRTGLAGSIPSMVSYVVTAQYVFLAARRFTHDSRASFVGALLFILNPDILYLQSTPLSEMICIVTSIMACYYLLAWVQEEHIKHLLLSAGCTVLATLTRYEGWALFLALIVVVIGIGLAKRQPRVQIEGNVLVFALLAGLGIGVWLLWGADHFSTPFYFVTSQYAVQTQLSHALTAQSTATYHNLGQSFRFYTLACIRLVGPSLAALTLFSLAISVAISTIRFRFKPEMLVLLALAVPCIFSLATLYNGLVTLSVAGTIPQAVVIYPDSTAIVPAMAILVAMMAGGWRLKLLPRWKTALQVFCVALIVGQSLLLVVNL